MYIVAFIFTVVINGAGVYKNGERVERVRARGALIIHKKRAGE